MIKSHATWCDRKNCDGECWDKSTATIRCNCSDCRGGPMICNIQSMPPAEPRTAEEWANWAINSWEKDLNGKNGSEWVTEAIHLAQGQSRKQAIEDCAEIADDHPYDGHCGCSSQIEAKILALTEKA